MAAEPHLSIGEVLALVQDDFPDVTISKIRFLESQGLLEPERTPSGYRKFYPADIERLRWILAQQRDNFLPLRVIKERIPGVPSSGGPTDAGETMSEPEDDPIREARRAASSLAAGSAMEIVGAPAVADRAGEQVEPVVPADATDVVAGDGDPDPGPVAAGDEVADSDDGAPDSDAHDSDRTAPRTSVPKPIHVGPPDTALTAIELAERAGVDVRVVQELESFSMIESRRVGPESYFDPEHLAVVSAARIFIEHGIEVRHLRMYKIAAEREAGVFEQLVMPLLKQRNPDARARAVELVRDLAEAGEELHHTLLRQALRQTLP